MFPLFDFRDVQEKLSAQFRPWERSFQFWVRVADIYTGYKVSVYDFCVSAWDLESWRFNLLCGCCRCFNYGWNSRRMWRNRRQCGRISMNMQLRRYMLCAPKWVVSSLRYSVNKSFISLEMGFLYHFSRLFSTFISIEREIEVLQFICYRYRLLYFCFIVLFCCLFFFFLFESWF